MFKSFANVLGAARDKAVEAAARSWLNRKFEQFGTVTHLELDSRQKTVFLEAALRGETTPVWIRIIRYDLTQAEGKSWITVRQIEASREWLTTAANEYLAGRPFPLPEAVKFAL